MITSGLVALRPLCEADLGRMSRWDQDDEIAWLMGIDSAARAAAASTYRRMMKDRNARVMAILTAQGHLIGDIALSRISWRGKHAELVVRIGEKSYWNQGFGTEAVMKVLGIAFGRLGLANVYLRVCQDNLRAVRCYEKCGFRRTGMVVRELGDERTPRSVLLMEMRREDWHAAARAVGAEAG